MAPFFFRVTCKTCSGPVEGRRADALYCSKSCANSASNSRHYAKRCESIRRAGARHRAAYPDRLMLARAKRRAEASGIPFDLNTEDISIPDVCPVLGLPLSVSQGSGAPGHCSPSLDRIIPELGYVRGNVRVISHRANALKSNATISELRAVLSDLENLRRDIRL